MGLPARSSICTLFCAAIPQPSDPSLVQASFSVALMLIAYLIQQKHNPYLKFNIISSTLGLNKANLADRLQEITATAVNLARHQQAGQVRVCSPFGSSSSLLEAPSPSPHLAAWGGTPVLLCGGVFLALQCSVVSFVTGLTVWWC